MSVSTLQAFLPVVLMKRQNTVIMVNNKNDVSHEMHFQFWFSLFIPLFSFVTASVKSYRN